MKLAILTQPLHHNYGGLLQNYALQQVIKRDGHQVETVWFYTPKVSRFNILKSRCKRGILHFLFPKRFSPFRYFLSDKDVAFIHANTNYFINKYITRSKHTVKEDRICDYVNKECFDGYIVGSDQCWRPKYNEGPFLPIMFLDFAKDIRNVKRIAYAASFGTDEWEMTPEMTDICSLSAKKFNLITVREDSGVKLCKDHLAVDAIHVLDPTMLLTREDYIALVDAENEPKSSGTLFTYILDPTSEKSEFVSRMAVMNGLIPFTVMPKYQSEVRTEDNIRNHKKDCVYPRVTAWLRAFVDAEMTIVDSFHGVVFSILFNKPFWVIGNRERGMSRFTSLLRMFGLQDRLIDESEIGSFVANRSRADLFQAIDWHNVNNILEKERTRCMRLLLTSLEGPH